MRKAKMISGLILCVGLFLLGAAAYPASGMQEDSQMTGHRYGPKENSMGYEGPRGGRRAGPPQEAIDACNGRSEGDRVEFETPRGDVVSGICREIHGRFAAVPENGPPRGGHFGPPQDGRKRRGSGPPQEAIAACSGRSDGDKVEFETPNGRTVSGTCRELNDMLVAVPEGPPPGVGGDQ